jgi:hypothetical protein
MKALLKIVIPIEIYYDMQTWVGSPIDISYFKPGNAGYDFIFRNLENPVISEWKELQNWQALLNANLDIHHNNGSILSEVFPEDRLEIDEENMTLVIYQRWESKEALEEHAYWRWVESHDVATILSHEIIDLPNA